MTFWFAAYSCLKGLRPIMGDVSILLAISIVPKAVLVDTYFIQLIPHLTTMVTTRYFHWKPHVILLKTTLKGRIVLSLHVLLKRLLRHLLGVVDQAILQLTLLSLLRLTILNEFGVLLDQSNFQRMFLAIINVAAHEQLVNTEEHFRFQIVIAELLIKTLVHWLRDLILISLVALALNVLIVNVHDFFIEIKLFV